MMSTSKSNKGWHTGIVEHVLDLVQQSDSIQRAKRSYAQEFVSIQAQGECSERYMELKMCPQIAAGKKV